MNKPVGRIEYTEEYKSGYKAYERGGSVRDCPYMKNSKAYELWMRGYQDAKDDDEQDSL